MVTTKFDSDALIKSLAYGHSARSAAISMLAMADAFANQALSISALPNNIIFSFFGAETWAYAGSSRFAKDIYSGITCQDTAPSDQCSLNRGKGCSNPCLATLDFQNIKLEKIAGIVDLDTIGLLNSDISSTANMYIHVNDLNSRTTNLAQNFQGSITSSGFGGSNNVTVQFNPAFSSNINNRLPPSSAMSFLKLKGDIPAIVISDYNTTYSNQ